MAVTGVLYLTGTLAGEPEGSSTVALSWTITAGISDALVDLASGANTITVPSGTTVILVIPPTANTQTITAKGLSADTGFQLSKTAPSVIAWQTGSSFVLTAGGTITGLKVLFI